MKNKWSAEDELCIVCFLYVIFGCFTTNDEEIGFLYFFFSSPESPSALFNANNPCHVLEVGAFFAKVSGTS